MYPKEIIVEDEDGGFIIVRYDRAIEDADEQFIYIYKHKSYHHDIESAKAELES